MSKKKPNTYTYRKPAYQRMAELGITEQARRPLREYTWQPPGQFNLSVPVTVFRCYGDSEAGTPYRWIREIQFWPEDRTRTLVYGLARHSQQETIP